MRIVPAMCCVAAIAAATVCARPIPAFDYDRLFSMADLVVIASALKTQEADEEENPLGGGYVGTNTTFKVRYVLQGKTAARKIDVLHFKSRVKGVMNAPRLTEFVNDKDEAPVLTSPLQAPQYLLFLSRMPDGRYAPVTGQTDSSISFRKISIPPEHEEEKARE